MKHSDKKIILIGVLLVAFFSTTLSVFLIGDDSYHYDPIVEYCGMVEIYKSSNGVDGWPDYRNIYYKECK